MTETPDNSPIVQPAKLGWKRTRETILDRMAETYLGIYDGLKKMLPDHPQVKKLAESLELREGMTKQERLAVPRRYCEELAGTVGTDCHLLQFADHLKHVEHETKDPSGKEEISKMLDSLADSPNPHVLITFITQQTSMNCIPFYQDVVCSKGPETTPIRKRAEAFWDKHPLQHITDIDAFNFHEPGAAANKMLRTLPEFKAGGLLMDAQMMHRVTWQAVTDPATAETSYRSNSLDTEMASTMSGVLRTLKIDNQMVKDEQSDGICLTIEDAAARRFAKIMDVSIQTEKNISHSTQARNEPPPSNQLEAD